MKKILISEEEKSRILESHNKVRDLLMGHLFDKTLVSESNLVNEQGVKALQGLELLNAAKTGCGKLKTATVGKKANSKGVTMDALVLKAPAPYKDSVSGLEVFKAGDTLYYFPDMSYEVYTPTADGKEKLVYLNNWTCKAIDVVGQDLETRKGALINVGWQEYDKLSAGDKESVMRNPELWMKLNIGPDTLVMSLRKKQGGELSTEALEYLKAYLESVPGVEQTSFDEISTEEQPDGITDENAKRFVLYDKATEEQRQRWMQIKVPKGDVLSKDLIILKNPSKDDAQSGLDVQRQTIDSQLISEKTCRTIFQQWYEQWQTDTREMDAVNTQNAGNAYKCYVYYKRGRYNAGPDTRKLIMALEGNDRDQNKYNVVSRTNQYNIINVMRKLQPNK